MIGLLLMTHVFIVLGLIFCFSVQAIEDLPVTADFMPEVHLAKQAIDEIKEEQKSSSDKSKDTQAQTTTQNQASAPAEENYRPSLTESLNDSNSQKNDIKRQLSADNPQTNLTENPTEEEEVANFGNVSVSISERKKEEKLKKVNENN